MSSYIVYGNGASPRNWWTIRSKPEEPLLVGIGGFLSGTDDDLNLWFGTKLNGQGSAELQSVHPESAYQLFQQSSGDGGELELRKVEIEFHVPVGFHVRYCTPESPQCSSGAVFARGATGAPAVRVNLPPK